MLQESSSRHTLTVKLFNLNTAYLDLPINNIIPNIAYGILTIRQYPQPHVLGWMDESGL